MSVFYVATRYLIKVHAVLSRSRSPLSICLTVKEHVHTEYTHLSQLDRFISDDVPLKQPVVPETLHKDTPGQGRNSLSVECGLAD